MLGNNSMTKLSQKKEEAFYASCLANKLKEEWAVVDSENEEEWPDLLVKTGDSEFGLEVRSLFKDENVGVGSPLKRKESLNINFLRRLKNEYYKICNIPVTLRVLGNFTNNDICDIAEIVKAEVDKIDVMQQVRLEYRPLDVIYITRLPEEFVQYGRWDNVGDSTSWECNLNSEVIKKAVLAKSEKLAKYKENVNDVRLLLVLNGLKSSGMVQLTEVENINCLGFNKIYIFLYPGEVRVFEGA